jgi:hypothetical protein
MHGAASATITDSQRTCSPARARPEGQPGPRALDDPHSSRCSEAAHSLVKASRNQCTICTLEYSDAVHKLGKPHAGQVGSITALSACLPQYSAAIGIPDLMSVFSEWKPTAEPPSIRPDRSTGGQVLLSCKPESHFGWAKSS